MRECDEDGKPCPYCDPAEFLGAPKPLNGCMCQDGRCESCNRVGEAFEAMRKALLDTQIALKTVIEHAEEKYPHFESERGQRDIDAAIVAGKQNADALALADEAAKAKP